jgi:hypothetical protein
LDLSQRGKLQTLKCTNTPVELWTICTERLELWMGRWTVCTERFWRRMERWMVCTERFGWRSVGTVWTFWHRFQNLHYGDSRYLLFSSLLFIYLFTNIQNLLFFLEKYVSPFFEIILVCHLRSDFHTTYMYVYIYCFAAALLHFF